MCLICASLLHPTNQSTKSNLADKESPNDDEQECESGHEDPFFELNYELAVQSPAEQFESMFKYVGLGSSWNATLMLDTASHKREVFTASSQQVKEALYTTSVKRWKRFEKYVRQSPLIDLLDVKDDF
jgi:hypothetical protein